MFYRDSTSLDGLAVRCIDCTVDARKENRERRKEGKPAKHHISEEERKRRSDRAKQMHAEGKLNAKDDGAKGGRPKVKSITEYVLDEMRSEGDLVLNALKSGLKAKSPNIKVRAAEMLMTIEGRDDDRRSKSKSSAEMSRGELIEGIVTGILELQSRGQLPEDIIEGTVVEVPHQQIEAPAA